MVRRGRDDTLAAERREVAAAEPVDRRLAPVAPEGVGVFWGDYAVAAAGDDQHAFFRQAQRKGQRRVDAVHGAQLGARVSRRLAAPRAAAAGEEAPGEVADADRRHHRDGEVEIIAEAGEERRDVAAEAEAEQSDR